MSNEAYSQNVQRIFSGDPNINQVRTLLQSYEQDVTTIFDCQPPDLDKQVRYFRSLKNDFEKAIASVVISATTDNDR